MRPTKADYIGARCSSNSSVVESPPRPESPLLHRHAGPGGPPRRPSPREIERSDSRCRQPPILARALLFGDAAHHAAWERNLGGRRGSAPGAGELSPVCRPPEGGLYNDGRREYSGGIFSRGGLPAAWFQWRLVGFLGCVVW